MTTSPTSSEVSQASNDAQVAADLRADAAVLGLSGHTETVRAALGLLHQRAAVERMAQSVDGFYGERTPPLPIGVRRAPIGAADDADGRGVCTGSAA